MRGVRVRSRSSSGGGVIFGSAVSQGNYTRRCVAVAVADPSFRCLSYWRRRRARFETVATLLIVSWSFWRDYLLGARHQDAAPPAPPPSPPPLHPPPLDPLHPPQHHPPNPPPRHPRKNPRHPPRRAISLGTPSPALPFKCETPRPRRRPRPRPALQPPSLPNAVVRRRRGDNPRRHSRR